MFVAACVGKDVWCRCFKRWCPSLLLEMSSSLLPSLDVMVVAAVVMHDGSSLPPPGMLLVIAVAICGMH